MEDDYGSNVHAGLEKKCPLYVVSALECPLWKGFVIRDSLGIRPGQNFCPLYGGSTVVKPLHFIVNFF